MKACLPLLDEPTEDVSAFISASPYDLTSIRRVDSLAAQQCANEMVDIRYTRLARLSNVHDTDTRRAALLAVGRHKQWPQVQTHLDIGARLSPNMSRL